MLSRQKDNISPGSLPDGMTIEQLCSYLQLSRSTVYKLSQEKKLLAQKVGKHWRFHKQAKGEWLSRLEEGER